MNRYLRKTKNGLRNIFMFFLAVMLVFVFAVGMVLPVFLAMELYWGWLILYLPFVIFFAYCIGEE